VAHDASHSHDDKAHAHGPMRYFIVWALLMILTVTTVVTGHMELGNLNIVLALVIATIKATLVVLFFMHMTEAAGANRLVFVVSIVFCIVMMIGVFGDLWTRNPMTLPTGSPPAQIQAE
jgi:cytochrome c oxidase subunit 4